MALLNETSKTHSEVCQLASVTPKRHRQVTPGSSSNRSTGRGAVTSTPMRTRSKQFGLKWAWAWVLVDGETSFVDSPMIYGSCKGSRCRSLVNKKHALGAQRSLKKARVALREMKQLANRLKQTIISYQDTLERANCILQVDLEKDVAYEQLLERIRVCVNTLQ